MQFFLTNLVVVNELEVLDRSNILTILIDNKNLVKGVIWNDVSLFFTRIIEVLKK